jgi:hypothetical protein
MQKTPLGIKGNWTQHSLVAHKAQPEKFMNPLASAGDELKIRH